MKIMKMIFVKIVQNKFGSFEIMINFALEPIKTKPMKSYKVRFHLGRGKNFMKWQVTSPCGFVEYYDPTECQLILTDCVVKNSRKVAEKIFNGGEKVVCAWVLCDAIHINFIAPFIQADNKDQSNRLRYNPRVTPNWVYGGVVVDGCKFQKLVSVDRGLYII